MREAADRAAKQLQAVLDALDNRACIVVVSQHVLDGARPKTSTRLHKAKVAKRRSQPLQLHSLQLVVHQVLVRAVALARPATLACGVCKLAKVLCQRRISCRLGFSRVLVV